MLISKARSTNPISSIFLVFIFWVINLFLSFREVFFDFSTWTDFILIKLITAHLSILGISVLLNRTLQKNKLVGIGDALSGILFLVFILGLNDVHKYYKEFVGLFLITLGNSQLIGLYNSQKNYLKEFEIGILFGLSVVIYPNLFLMISIIFIGISLVVPFSWRDFIVPLLGCLWILFVKCALFFILGIGDFDINFEFYFSVPKLKTDFDLGYILFFLLALFELFVFLRIFSILEKRSIKDRAFYWLWLWTFIFLSLSLLFFQKSLDKFLFIAFLGLPCSLFSVEYFLKKGNLRGYWKKEFLIYLIIIIQFSLRIY